MKRRRVAVTGLGIVSAVGLGKERFWEAVVSGRDGFSEISSFDASSHRTRRGAEVKDFSPRETGAYLREAARQALSDAGLAGRRKPGRRLAVFVGTTFGESLGLNRLMDGLRAGKTAPEDFRRQAAGLFPGRLSSELARAVGARGPQATVTAACAAGNVALAAAFESVGSGEAEAALAGGVDLFSPVIHAGFNRLLAVAAERCAPFSLGRQGLIVGEGCGLLLVEEWERARRRRARIYAELLGYGLSCDAKHVTAPDAAGVARAIADALRQGELSPDDIDYVNAHGTGTPANDRTETAALKSVFGARATKVPVSSIKGVLGHAMGAASALEAAACCLAIESRTLPPTAHFAPGDPECDLDYVPTARRSRLRHVLSDAFAFGGSNCVLALAAPRPRRAAGAWRTRRVVVTAAATVESGDPVGLARRLMPDKDLGLLDEPIACALCGVFEALRQSGLKGGDDIGLVLESSGELDAQLGFYRELVAGGPGAVEPAKFPNILANAAAGRAGQVFGLGRAGVSLAGAYPGGEGAVAFAWRLLRRGMAETMLAGGVDGSACIFALETEESARRRGARVLAEISAVAESFDPGPALARPSEGCFCLARAVEKAAETGKPASYRCRSRWGGRLRLSLKKPSQGKI